jgi:hypothetical protein
MKSLTKNILSFYDYNEDNAWYLKKSFSHINRFGTISGNTKDIYSVKNIKKGIDVGTVDEHNGYFINSFGLRGEVKENVEILGSGCSITFGIGIPESGTWPKLLGDKINKNIMNLGSPGASAQTICIDIINYCLNNKMPKQIFCLFPDFFRSFVVEDKEFYKSKREFNPDLEDDHLGFTFCNPKVSLHEDSLLMEIENKKYIEDYTSPHQLILNSINAIYTLEAFCLSNNIQLFWTTWDIGSNMIMDKLLKIENFKLKNFVSFFPHGMKKTANTFIYEACKSDHKSKLRNNLCWNRGSDYSVINGKKTTDYAHPGIHFQYHFSEFFYNLYEKNMNKA